MLSRRQLRIKVMQALYAYYSDDERDGEAKYKELSSVFEHILLLYQTQLSLLVKLRIEVGKVLKKAKQKQMPTDEDLNPNMRFANNPILRALENDKRLKQLFKNNNVELAGAEDLIRITARTIQRSHEYLEYLQLEDVSFEDDRKFLKRIFKRHIMDNDLWEDYYSEGNLYWAANIDIANRLVLDTFDDFKQSSTLPSSSRSHVFTKLLNKDEEAFVKKLFQLTIKNDSDFQTWISEKAKNWDSERIASMDMLLMKMAICEILEFPVIPVKVSMNEYIEISKKYSAVESKGFINGILDKIITDLKENKKIKKKGKGLIES